MISLKAFCEQLAPLMAASPNALYERQRALVRLGELPEPAKGRGLGLPATPSTVAILVVSVLATANLSDTDSRVHKLAKARCKPRCKLTGKSHFVDALAAIFGSFELASKVLLIRAYRGEHAAQIEFHSEDVVASGAPREIEATLFGRPRDFPDQMEVHALLSSYVIKKIEQLMRSTREKQA